MYKPNTKGQRMKPWESAVIIIKISSPPSPLLLNVIFWRIRTAQTPREAHLYIIIICIFVGKGFKLFNAVFIELWQYKITRDILYYYYRVGDE